MAIAGRALAWSRSAMAIPRVRAAGRPEMVIIALDPGAGGGEVLRRRRRGCGLASVGVSPRRAPARRRGAPSHRARRASSSAAPSPAARRWQQVEAESEQRRPVAWRYHAEDLGGWVAHGWHGGEIQALLPAPRGTTGRRGDASLHRKLSTSWILCSDRTGSARRGKPSSRRAFNRWPGGAYDTGDRRKQRSTSVEWDGSMRR